MRVIVLVLLATTCLAEDEFIDIKQALLGKDLLPRTVPVSFSFQGSDLEFQLEKDDKQTEQLTESIFETAPHLPKGVFKDGESNEGFAFYKDESGNSFVLHREDENKPCKMYGSFYSGADRFVVMADDNHDTQHRVVHQHVIRQRQVVRGEYLQYTYEGQAERQGHRSKRAVIQGTTKIIELFLFSDFTIWNDLSGFSTLDEKKLYIRDIMRSMTKDLDTMFNYMTNDSAVELRVYFQEYQVATLPSASPWSNDNVVSGALPPNALTDFTLFMGNLVDNFFFPQPDIAVGITKYDLKTTGSDTTSRYFVTNDLVCSGTGRLANALIEMKDGWTFKNLAMAVAEQFGLVFDGSTNSCSSADNYVMSNLIEFPILNQYANPLTFSPCSIIAFETFFNTSSFACLLTEDFQFDWPSFEAVINYGERFTLTQQCENIFGTGTTTCDSTNSVTACWEGTTCSVGSLCTAITVGQLTPCTDTENRADQCKINKCLDYPQVNPAAQTSTTTPITTSATNTPTPTTNPTTTSAPTTTTTTGATTSTTPELISSTSPIISSSKTTDCIPIEAGETYFDIPCSCDCPGASEQVCRQTNQDTCPPESEDCDCCAGQVKVDIKYLPVGCDIDLGKLNMGNTTKIIDDTGANIEDIFTTGYVYFDGSNWQVHI